MQLKQHFKTLGLFLFIFISLEKWALAQMVPKQGETNQASYPIDPPKFGHPSFAIPSENQTINSHSKPAIREEIIQFAMNYLGIRYRSSGKSPKIGFDCSGFTGFIFKNFGMKLKASSPAQAMEGRKVPVSEAKEGDLAFFGKKGKKGKVYVNHAAIVISKPGEPLAIIHSASNKGIVITKVNESNYWRNALLFVRNVL
jgi:cell wall-associated NlpC family hydrolase